MRAASTFQLVPGVLGRAPGELAVLKMGGASTFQMCLENLAEVCPWITMFKASRAWIGVLVLNWFTSLLDLLDLYVDDNLVILEAMAMIWGLGVDGVVRVETHVENSQVANARFQATTAIRDVARFQATTAV
ncbi:hypothetical protein TEA_020197 [Camellia sinensis var. sinensis]|uniref:Uncharacterized protein n=1 Tax=Camellia sinensis var. sinensis TaxID=542762 RepID=A0A4S4DFC0_CAMSN|nr:hypothetical protein TEA_020197 [Camellia sinensis var. sinensis]